MFPWAQNDNSGPGSQTRAAGGLGPLNKGCERRTWALPDVSGGGKVGQETKMNPALERNQIKSLSPRPLEIGGIDSNGFVIGD
jgi:hypothetical protein